MFPFGATDLDRTVDDGLVFECNWTPSHWSGARIWSCVSTKTSHV